MMMSSSPEHKYIQGWLSDPWSWWRHQMETFSTLLAPCAGNSLVTGEFPSQKPVTWSFDVFFDLCLNKWLSKQSWSWWFEMPSHSLWPHCNNSRAFIAAELTFLTLNMWVLNYLGLTRSISWLLMTWLIVSLHWRNNGRDSVSNHQPHDCLLNCLFRHRSKKTSKLRVTGLCVGNSPGAGKFPAQMASNAENVSIWWRHHVSPGHQQPWYGLHKLGSSLSSMTKDFNYLSC